MAKRNKSKQKADEVQAVGSNVISIDEAAAQLAEDAPTEITAEGEAVAVADLTHISRATADCMTAKEDSCSCRCRGKYHGKEHPKGWKDEVGNEPLNETERKAAKKAALYAWRKAHPERVSAYMKQWRDDKKKQATAEGADEPLTEEAEGSEVEAGE